MYSTGFRIPFNTSPLDATPFESLSRNYAEKQFLSRLLKGKHEIKGENSFYIVISLYGERTVAKWPH